MNKNDLKNERRLFGIWLDISYAVDINVEAIEEAEFDLKSLKKSLSKSKKLLKKVSARYEEIYGRKPSRIKDKR